MKLYHSLFNIRRMFKIKEFFRKVRNIIRWFPVIYKDRDWDHWFIYQILKTKLKHQSEHLRKHGYHDSSESDADRIDLCIRLIEKVQNEEYLDVALRESQWTMQSMEAAERKHNKARKLLFKVLEQNIERWWS
jgi:hypothetical protein